MSINKALDEPLTLAETVKAIGQLSNGKAPGLDSIPAEVYKNCGKEVVEKLHELYQLMWEKESTPRTSVMLVLCTCTKTKEIDRHVITTEVSPYSALLVKSLLEFC